ncbi:hypothetical protein ACIPY0_12190 [Paenarthrobacter nicotinovorans]|uniref:hypothetical protein n=1 Tax=Paenarthrobacter nicotinovorans TaxID=29320 RepID=UPI003827D46B
MQTLDNGITVPTNSDDYNPANDMANAFGQVPGATRVANQAARDALTKYDGRKAQRMDLPGQPIDTWDASANVWLPKAPANLSFSSNYRQAGTWFSDAIRPASVTRSERRVSSSGALANDVPIFYTANTEYTLATFPAEYAPKTSSEFFTVLVNAFQCNMWVTPAGEIKISFLVAVGSAGSPIAIGKMVFPLSGMGWNS